MSSPDAVAERVALESALIDAARLNIRIRQLYVHLKNELGGRYYTYVILLQHGKIYVGSSDNIYIRLYEHEMQTPQSAGFVREHGPVVRVLEISRNCRADDETYKTLEYMSLFGHENVRGAGWCRGELRAPPADVATFQRARSSTEFEYLTRKEIDDIMDVVRSL
jgi:predicted GIY-YIG superfamily endonuclease